MSWHLYLMALLYILAGGMHFLNPRMYLRIMPPYIPAPKVMVAVSGLAEITLGVALFFEATKDMALYGLLLMLIVFLPVHVHMLMNKKAASGLPAWALLLRIPLQFGLMYWAYSYLAV